MADAKLSIPISIGLNNLSVEDKRDLALSKHYNSWEACWFDEMVYQIDEALKSLLAGFVYAKASADSLGDVI